MYFYTVGTPLCSFPNFNSTTLQTKRTLGTVPCPVFGMKVRVGGMPNELQDGLPRAAHFAVTTWRRNNPEMQKGYILRHV